MNVRFFVAETHSYTGTEFFLLIRRCGSPDCCARTYLHGERNTFNLPSRPSQASDLRLANAVSTGSVSVTVSGGGLGAAGYSVGGRTGVSGCEGSECVSETSVACMVVSGVSGTMQVGLTVGGQAGSTAEVVSLGSQKVSPLLSFSCFPFLASPLLSFSSFPFLAFSSPLLFLSSTLLRCFPFLPQIIASKI